LQIPTFQTSVPPPSSGSKLEVFTGVSHVGRLQGDATVMRREERTQVEELSKEEVTLILRGNLGLPLYQGMGKRLA
jgi:hypothetical protein